MVSTHIVWTTSVIGTRLMRTAFLFPRSYASSREWHRMRSDPYHLPPDVRAIKTITTQIKPPCTLPSTHLCGLITVQSACLKIQRPEHVPLPPRPLASKNDLCHTSPLIRWPPFTITPTVHLPMHSILHSLSVAQRGRWPTLLVW